MKIKELIPFLDGGTVGIITDEGDYYLDGRIGTLTKGMFYDCYPDEGSLIQMTDELRFQICSALNVYGGNSKESDFPLALSLIDEILPPYLHDNERNK